jgi:hypothetical protein
MLIICLEKIDGIIAGIQGTIHALHITCIHESVVAAEHLPDEAIVTNTAAGMFLMNTETGMREIEVIETAANTDTLEIIGIELIPEIEVIAKRLITGIVGSTKPEPSIGTVIGRHAMASGQIAYIVLKSAGSLQQLCAGQPKGKQRMHRQ